MACMAERVAINEWREHKADSAARYGIACGAGTTTATSELPSVHIIHPISHTAQPVAVHVLF